MPAVMPRAAVRQATANLTGTTGLDTAALRQHADDETRLRQLGYKQELVRAAGSAAESCMHACISGRGGGAALAREGAAASIPRSACPLQSTRLQSPHAAQHNSAASSTCCATLRCPLACCPC